MGNLGIIAILFCIVAGIYESRTFRLWFFGITAFVFFGLLAQAYPLGFFIGVVVFILMLWLLVQIFRDKDK